MIQDSMHKNPSYKTTNHIHGAQRKIKRIYIKVLSVVNSGWMGV